MIGKTPPPPIYAVFVVLGSVVTLVIIGHLLAGLTSSAAVYLTAPTVDFFTVIFGFVNALEITMAQLTEPSDKHKLES